MRILYKRNIRRWITIFLINIIVISSFNGFSENYAIAADDWVKIDDSYNNLSQETEVDGDTIIQKGKHHSADDDVIRYETKYYRMTLDTYDLNKMFTEEENAEIPYAYVPFTFGNERVNGTTKYVEYIIHQSDFMSAAASKQIGITGDYLHEHGKATVYLNNVFRIMKGSKELDSYVYGYQEMLDEAGWSDLTVDYLKGYYNFKYVISDISFLVKVIAVDEDDNVINNDLLGNEKRAIYQEEIPPYTLANDTIEKDGITYKYQDTWKYTYKDRSSEKTKTLGSYTGKDVSFSAPDADPGTTLTVKMVFKKQVPDYYYRIEAVDKNHNTLGDIISDRNKKVTRYNKTVSYDIDSPLTFNGNRYNYYNQWYLTYENSAGKNITEPTEDGNISKQMPNAKESTTAVFHVVYDTSPITPTPTPKVTVTPKPSITAAPTATPTPYIVISPEPSPPISISLDSPTPYGVINADNYNSPYFISRQAISTTESQYVYVKTKDYLLGYTLVNRTGKLTYMIPVTKHYTLEYYSATPEEYRGPTPTVVIKKEDRTQIIPVEKAYSYWEITDLQYYYPVTASVTNYSLPDGKVSLTADNNYLDIPSLSTWHSSKVEDHVLPPIQEEKGIDVWADKPIKSNTSVKPDIEYEDFSHYAYEQTDESRVRNDSFVFDGRIVLSDGYNRKISSSPYLSNVKQCTGISQDKAFFTDKKVIDAKKLNGTYPSSGNVTYKLHSESINAEYPAKTYTVNVNSVTIHTPVICNPIIYGNNDEWTQLVSPVKDAVQIVLDPDSKLNDFTVNISNTLLHTNLLGYYTRDFSRSFIDPENVSYIAKVNGIVRNEMKLPFDVYIDISSDNNPDNDKFIKAGTWIVMGRATSRFYVPMWVQEGTYTAQFRTIAVNGTDKLNNTEVTRNSSIYNYVATSIKTFQISGRIYGLTLYDISDYPNWENVFRKEDTMLFKLFEGFFDGTKQPSFNTNYAYYYRVGTKNQYGLEVGRYSKYTVPLVNGSHPKFKNLGVLKTGYAVRFMLDTTGEMYSSACKVKITPTFYHVDANGKNRQRVDLYYKEEIKNKVYNIVKVGDGIDLVNIQSGHLGNIYSRVPVAEIRQTAAVLDKKYSQVANKLSTMYSYSMIKLLPAFRTFIGTDYASHISGLPSFNDVRTATGQTKTNLSKYMQRWYGTYKLPTNLHAVKAGYDVVDYLKKHGIDYQEDFWLKDGYIIVNFNIVTLDDNGKEHLSYINASNYLNNGNCSMWVKEGAVVQKTDYKGNIFNFYAGDFMINYLGKKMTDDYEGQLY